MTLSSYSERKAICLRKTTRNAAAISLENLHAHLLQILFKLAKASSLVEQSPRRGLIANEPDEVLLGVGEMREVGIQGVEVKILFPARGLR